MNAIATILAAALFAFIATAAFNTLLAITGPDWPQYQGEMK